MKTDHRHFNTNMTQSNPTVQRPQVNMIGQLQDEHILQISDYRALLLWAIPATHKLTGSIWNDVRCSWYGHHFPLENLKTNTTAYNRTNWLISPFFCLLSQHFFDFSLFLLLISAFFSSSLSRENFNNVRLQLCGIYVLWPCILSAPSLQTHVYSIAISFESKYSLVLSDVCVQYFL